VVVTAAVGYWVVTQPVITPSSWAFELTETTALQDEGLDGTGVRVCIVDTGVDLTHPDLGHVNLLAWRDFVNGRSQAYDDEGHGTAMAGIIFARGRLRGVAPAADLIAVKAIGSSGSGGDRGIADAVDFCTDPDGDGSPTDGAHVISLSLGGNSTSSGTRTEDAVNRAIDAGIIVIAAAGNDGQSDDGDVESPASVERVIAVGAVDSRGRIASFSSMGAANSTGIPPSPRQDPNRKPEVAAPGVQIATTLNGARYGLVSGTSPAAALVSGIVALLLQRHPQYRHDPFRVDVFKNALMDAALPVDVQDTPHDAHYGYGIPQGDAMSLLL
jgi:serine protease AprX